jgi:UDP-2,3-diacylglucosamine pyrophosphatase LpxH
MNTIIVSDLHLGARNSRTDLLAGLLDSDFDRLILNGDVVDAPDPRRFRPGDWQVIDTLRAVARRRELVVVRGNHDVPTFTAPAREASVVADLFGVELLEEYQLQVGGDRYLVVHGDRYDNTMNMTWVGDAADLFYQGVQRLSRPLAHFLKSASKHVCGVVPAVRGGALASARERGFVGVITGHTHFAHDEHIDGIHFLNTGCWVDHPCSYVQAEGRSVRLRHWSSEAMAVSVRKEPAALMAG